MSDNTESKIISSSGNVFADLGVKNPEEYLAKAQLAAQINKILAGKKQKEIIQLLGIDQPKVSALVNGRLSGFSLSKLISFLNKLNQDVEIVVKPSSAKSAKRSKGQGHLSVHTC